MIDPELQGYLSGINHSLTEIKEKRNPGIWRSFFNGMFSAFGYLVGVVLVIVIVGWFLAKTGLLIPFQDQWQKFENFMNQAESTLNTVNNVQNQQGSVQSGSIITLPDGSRVRVEPAQ